MSRHTTAPVYLQRAAVIAVVSFVFFLATLAAFYIRQNIGYFALSSAFLVVYVFTLVGWVMQRRNVVNVHENGLKYKRFHAAWGEIDKVTANSEGLALSKGRRDKTLIPTSVSGFDAIVRAVRHGIETKGP